LADFWDVTQSSTLNDCKRWQMMSGDDPNKTVKTWVETHGTLSPEELWWDKSRMNYPPMMEPSGMGGRNAKLYDLRPNVTQNAQATK
jgi:hypothetical protein